MERESVIPIPTATLFLVLLLVARLSWAANPTLLTIRDDVDTSGLAPCKAAKIGRGPCINDATQIFHNIGPPPPCHFLLSYSSIQSSTIRTTPSHLQLGDKCRGTGCVYSAPRADRKHDAGFTRFRVDAPNIDLLAVSSVPAWSLLKIYK